MSGNTFTGVLLEFPQICIDRFNVDATVYLLTHYHSDHMNGLINQKFNSPVLCSELTRKLISADPNYRHNLSFLKPKPWNVPYTVTVDDEEIRITLIPSYHCPGSSMFLIESGHKSVLVTGDLRAEPWFTQSLSKNVHLLPYMSGLKVLDNIYLDTTFGYRGEPFIDILPNSDGICTVAKLLQMYPKDDPDIQVHFHDHILGFEECWTQIISMVDGSVAHFDETLLRRNKLISDPYLPYTRLGDGFLEPNHEKIGFHICKECDSKPKFKVSIKQRINFNIIDLVGCLLPIYLDSISEQETKEMVLIDTTSKGYEIYEFRNRIWLKVGTELLPNDLKLMFSRHSSYQEAIGFVKLFKPKQVYPCVETETTWKNGFLMSRVFGQVCVNTKLEQFAYDYFMAKTIGIPKPEILERPIRTINRWDLNQCEQELEFVRTYMDIGLEIKAGQLNFQPSKEPILISELVMKRNDDKFNWFIQQSHLLYKKYLTRQLPGQRPFRPGEIEYMEKLMFNCESQTSTDSNRTVSENVNSNRTYNSGSANSKHEDDGIVTEFGIATKLPTVRDIPGIESSFNATEFSCEVTCGNPEIDPASINKLSKRLKRDPDYYLGLRLECVER